MDGIETLVLIRNALEGSLVIAEIPRTMRKIALNVNNLSGSVHLENLHDAIVELMISQNRFSGGLCLENLPKSLKELSISQNNFTGKVHIVSHLPPLFIANTNKFTFVDVAPELWKNVDRFDVSNNAIEQETVKLGPLGNESMYIDLHGNDIRRCVTENGITTTSKRVLYDNGTEEQRRKSAKS